MIWLVFTAMFAAIEAWYDQHIYILKRHLIRTKDDQASRMAHKLMHKLQMPLRGVFFLLMIFGSAGNYYDDAYRDLAIVLSLNLIFFWWLFDILMNKFVLKMNIAYMSTKGWEAKYFGWAGGWGYLALKTILLILAVGVAIHYNAWE